MVRILLRRIGRPCQLCAVGSGECAEVIIESVILLNDDHHVIDRHGFDLASAFATAFLQRYRFPGGLARGAHFSLLGGVREVSCLFKDAPGWFHIPYCMYVD